MSAIIAVFDDFEHACAIMRYLGLEHFQLAGATCTSLAAAAKAVLEEWAVLRKVDDFEVYQSGVVRALCTLPGHNLVLGDTYNHRMQVHNPQLRTHKPSTMPRLWKEIFYPQGLAYEDGNLYVSTACSLMEGVGNVHRVLKFRLSDGVELGASAPGVVRFPQALALDGQNLLVVEGGRISVLDKDDLRRGGFFGEAGSAVGQLCRPVELALHRGELFVADQGNHRLSIFSPGAEGFLDVEGASVRTLGSHGTAPGQFVNPAGLAIAVGHLIVGEKTRVQVLTIDGAPRQVILMSGIDAICVGPSPMLYLADSLGERRIHRFEIISAAQTTERAAPCRASWGCGQIRGPSRAEQMAAFQANPTCVIQ